MYRDFYGFKEKPFGLTPDPRFVYLSKNHSEVFAHLWYGLHHGGGFIALTGEIGTGKTTMLRVLLSRLDPAKWHSALIFNPAHTGDSLLKEVLREFGLPCGGDEHSRRVRTLTAFLLRENAAGRSVLLILDEAQNLLPEVLEEIRLLSNLETESRKLLHIVLAGQPELSRMLRRPGLRQLNQRISVRYHLRGMDAFDTCSYIRHRLRRAGADPVPLFSAGSLQTIHRLSGGVPRLVNQVCDRCLLIGFTMEHPSVSRSMVRAAWRELRMGAGRFDALLRRPVLRYFSLGILLLSLAFWALSSYFRVGPGRFFAQPVPPAVQGDQFRNGQKVRPADMRAAVTAFNALSGAWQVPPLSDREKIGDLQDIRVAADARGLRISRIEGPLAAMLRLNYPLVIEISDGNGRRLLALTREQSGNFTVVPSLNGSPEAGLEEVEPLFTGRAFLVWRNALDLPSIFSSGARGRRIGDLQRLLKEAGSPVLQVDGVYGRRTAEAVKDFQKRQGLPPDETLGMETLLLLYQNAGRYEVPKLRR
jgi:general secretion pathway protein A